VSLLEEVDRLEESPIRSSRSCEVVLVDFGEVLLQVTLEHASPTLAASSSSDEEENETPLFGW
jgi:hypothetical protein